MSAPAETPSRLLCDALTEAERETDDVKCGCSRYAAATEAGRPRAATRVEMLNADEVPVWVRDDVVCAALLFLAHKLDEERAEATRLRAALAEIAALQTEEPQWGRFEPNNVFPQGEAAGLWKAAEMARAALVSK